MTKEFSEQMLTLLKNTKGGVADLEFDPLRSTAVDVFNKLLCYVKPYNNASKVGTGILAYLKGCDYRDCYFSKSIHTTCKVLEKTIENGTFKYLDNMSVLAYVSVFLYVQRTDIYDNEINTIFNGIIRQMEESMETHQPHTNSMNVLPSYAFSESEELLKQLEINSQNSMVDVMSLIGDLLGTDYKRPFKPKQTEDCAMRCMISPTQLGIRVDKFINANRRVSHQESVTLDDVVELVDELRIDTDRIDADKLGINIYDLINIRFCTWWYTLLSWILRGQDMVDAKSTFFKILKLLLETDKKFIGVGYCYLTLVEIIINCLDTLLEQGPSYYPYIRAKNLWYSEAEASANSALVYNKIYEIQKKILQILESDDHGSVMEALNQVISNARTDHCQGMMTETEVRLQPIDIYKIFLDQYNDEDDDIKKLLGESFEMSTMFIPSIVQIN